MLVVAFIIPVLQLALWSLQVSQSGEAINYLETILKTLFLGAAAALIICLSAILLSYAKRQDNSIKTMVLCRISTVGYALPGTVLAVGIFIPIAWFDNTIREALIFLFDKDPGPLLQGSIMVMLVAYLVRFLAVGFGSVDSAMQNIKPSLDEASALLGKGRAETLRKIHFPLLRKGILTALILTLVDVIKEMPITLMTRPFGWDTLAVKIYELTSEGEWVRAAMPGLYLVLAGIIPVAVLISQMEK